MGMEALEYRKDILNCRSLCGLDWTRQLHFMRKALKRIANLKYFIQPVQFQLWIGLFWNWTELDWIWNFGLLYLDPVVSAQTPSNCENEIVSQMYNV